MSDSINNLCIPLAAMFQAAHDVRTLAYEGSSDDANVRPLLESLFNNDVQSAAQVYGGSDKLQTGLQLVSGILGNQSRGPQSMDITRYSISLIHLEKKLAKHPTLGAKLLQELDTVDRQRIYFGDTLSESVVARLADIYQETISSLEPKIVVRGEEAHLKNTQIAAQIRAILLSGVRAAVLWRQMGGGRFTLMTKRSALANAARELRHSA